MARRFCFRTIKGRPDSLKRGVKIAFTLTQRKEHHHPHSPVAFAVTALSAGSESYEEFEWGTEIIWASYEVRERNGKKQCLLKGDRSPVVPPGMISPFLETGSWGDAIPSPHGADLSCVRVPGMTKRCISLVNRITSRGMPVITPVIAWSPTYNPISATSDLLLQTYFVKDSASSGTILDASDLSHPIFAEPLSYEKFSSPSNWELIEDHDGTIRFKNVEHEEKTSSEQGVETLTRSFNDMRKQLDIIVKSLEETQQRLLVVEESVGTNQTELLGVKSSLTTTREEISRLDRKVPDVSRLVASLGRTEEHLLAVEDSITKTQDDVKALESTRSDLSRVEALINRAQRQVSVANKTVVALVDHRIPAIETKTGHLDESLGHLQDQLSAARTNASTTQDRVDRLNRGVLAVQATADTLGASVGKDQDRLSVLEGGMGHLHQRLESVEIRVASGPSNAESPRAADGPRQSAGIHSSPTQAASPLASEHFTTIRRQLATFDRRFPVMEAKLDRLEKSVVRVEGRMPVIEEKAFGMVKLFDKTQDGLTTLQLSLGTTSDEVAGLGSRVTNLEAKTYHLEEPWGQSQPPSPGVFPSQSPLDPLLPQ